MKTIHYQPTREPPPKAVPNWQNQTNTQQTSETTTMKKDRKKQEDRLLKRLSLRDRRQQVRFREQIASDPLFLVV
jgi:hypothetical protein